MVFLTSGYHGPCVQAVARDCQEIESNNISEYLRICAGIVGLVRTARMELSDQQLLCVDTDENIMDHAEQAGAQVLSEVIGGDGYFEIAYRQSVRFVPSLDLNAFLSYADIRLTEVALSMEDDYGVVVITGGLGFQHYIPLTVL